MANVSAGDSLSLHIVLERVDPARNIAHDTVCEAYAYPALGPHRLPRPGTPSVLRD